MSAPQQITPEEDDILRRALFVPCATKEDLHRWIEIYLGLNFPDTIVDEESNTTPMDIIWEIYEKALANDDPDFSRCMAYASRDSFKTLGAAVLEVLAVCHLNRDVAHMAAIKAQAKKAQSYVKKFFRYPYLRDYVISANTERTEIVRYYNDATGDNLTRAQYSELTPVEQLNYREIHRYITIVICSMQGSNSEHVPFFVVDEVDVVPKQNQPAYQEAKSIPAAYEGKEPITLLTSTRKFAFGNVQRELDQASKTGLVVRHWNIIDVTEKCPPSRHLPHEPRIPIYYSRDDFSSISAEEYEALLPEKQEKYTLTEGYAGCLKKCKLFAMCRGQLATKQRFHPKNEKGEFTERPMPLLKSITFTTNKFRELNLDMAKAQLMCWQASQEGLIYPYLDRQKHLLTPAEMARRITGEKYPDNFTRAQLMALLKGRDGRWVAGIDFGFTHNFSIVLFYIDGNRAFVVGCWSQPELDPTEKLDLMERTIKEFEPSIYADPESADMIAFFKKRGYRCKDWSKGAGSVLAGIEIVRYKLHPSIGEPQVFFLKGDAGVEMLVDRLAMYHWALDAAGNPSNEPDDVVGQDEEGNNLGDDECDAFRYGIMNVFHTKGKVMAPREDGVKLPTPAQVAATQKAQQPVQHQWAQQIMQHALARAQNTEEGAADAGPLKGRKGSFFWDM